MPQAYRTELTNLDEAYRTARQFDVTPLCEVIEGWADRPMLMVGSGGSFSTATLAAGLNEHATGQATRAITPLEAVSKEYRRTGLACFSASGRNQDIITAFRTAAIREMEPLSALILAEHAPLQELQTKFGYADVVCMGHPSFKDGFLAVASLVASSILLVRAYRTVLGHSEDDLPETLPELIHDATSFSSQAGIRAEARRVMRKRDYASVLYSSELAAAAVDLESRFVEAALGPLHTADMRNFGHGRHFWMARKAQGTCVFALISEKQQHLGVQTVALLPEEVATMPVYFRGPTDMQAVAGLIVGLFVTESAAELAGVDPGKPGVPPFGRKLYNLRPMLERSKQADLNQAAALRRKGARLDDPFWSARYRQALQTINSSRYEALVVDYDGTLCDPRRRTEPISTEIAGELTRLVKEGAVLGLATGRGLSAAIELRASLPPCLHDRVLVGYYNGAAIRRLTDRDDPAVMAPRGTTTLVNALENDPMFSGKIRSSSVQISIGMPRGTRVEAAVAQVFLLMRGSEVDGEVLTSGHSIDVCLAGQSKEDLIDAVRATFGLGEGPILRVGDRGRHPGNDWKLLDSPLGLSVHEVSGHPFHCWSLAPAGVKGVQATAHYLRSLRWSSRGGRMKLSPAARA